MHKNEVLAQALNEANAQPSVHKGRVTLDVEFEGEGWLDAHPEGEDRGGYVPTWTQGEAKAYHNGEGGGWCAY